MARIAISLSLWRAHPFGGLRLWPERLGPATLAVALSIAAVTVFIVGLDGLFRAHLSADYVAFYTSPLWPRLPAICVMAALEEVKYRLVLMTALVSVAALIWRGKPPAWVFVLIIIAVQAANVGHLVLADPLYGSLRYWLVGSVWGWLYWRHGWAAALVGHAACHLALDPLLMATL